MSIQKLTSDQIRKSIEELRTESAGTLDRKKKLSIAQKIRYRRKKLLERGEDVSQATSEQVARKSNITQERRERALLQRNIRRLIAEQERQQFELFADLGEIRQLRKKLRLDDLSQLTESEFLLVHSESFQNVKQRLKLLRDIIERQPVKTLVKLDVSGLDDVGYLTMRSGRNLVVDVVKGDILSAVIERIESDFDLFKFHYPRPIVSTTYFYRNSEFSGIRDNVEVVEERENGVVIECIKIISTQQVREGEDLDLSERRMRAHDSRYARIYRTGYEDVSNGEGVCVYDALKFRYGSSKYAYISSLFQGEDWKDKLAKKLEVPQGDVEIGVTAKEVMRLLDDFRISGKGYDQIGNLVTENRFKPSANKPSFHFQIAQDHLFLLTGKKKLPYNGDEIWGEAISACSADLTEFLKTAALTGEIKIKSFGGYPRVVWNGNQIFMSKTAAAAVMKYEWIRQLDLPEDGEYTSCGPSFLAIAERKYNATDEYTVETKSQLSEMSWKIANEAKVSLEVYSHLNPETDADFPAKALDISKAYTSALERLKRVPRFQVTDSVKDGIPKTDMEGYVYLKSFSRAVSLAVHQTESHWMPMNLYRYLLDELDLGDGMEVTHYLSSNSTLDLSPIHEAIDYVYEKCPEGAKMMVNSFIGCSLKNTTSPCDEVAICNTAEELYHYVNKSKEQTVLEMANGQNIVMMHSESRKTYSSARPLAHYVYAEHIIHMNRLIRRLNTDVLGCRTDCLYINQYINTDDICKENPARGEVKPAELVLYNGKTNFFSRDRPEPVEWTRVDRFDEPIQSTQELLLEELLNKPTNRLILAYGGRGKTRFLNELRNELKARGETVHTFAPMRGQAKLVQGRTFHSGLGISVTGISNERPNAVKVEDGDWILLDELSMMGRQAISKLLSVKRQAPNIHIVGFWGKNQLPPVDGKDYLHTDAVGELFDGNFYELSKNYRNANKEFDLAIETNPVEYLHQAEKSDELPLYGIAFTNQGCALQNLKSLKKIMGKKKPITEVELNKYPCPVPLHIGGEFIVNSSSSKHDLDANERLTLVRADVEGDKFTFSTVDQESIVLSKKKIEQHLYLRYWITCHRSQGYQFSDEYGIAEWKCVPKDIQDKWAYVALSRTTNPANVKILNGNRLG